MLWVDLIWHALIWLDVDIGADVGLLWFGFLVWFGQMLILIWCWYCVLVWAWFVMIWVCLTWLGLIVFDLGWCGLIIFDLVWLDVDFDLGWFDSGLSWFHLICRWYWFWCLVWCWFDLIWIDVMLCMFCFELILILELC